MSYTAGRSMKQVERERRSDPDERDLLFSRGKNLQQGMINAGTREVGQSKKKGLG